MKGSVGILKGSVGILKRSVGILKGSVGILKGSVGILKGFVGILIQWYYEDWYFERWYFEPLPNHPTSANSKNVCQLILIEATQKRLRAHSLGTASGGPRTASPASLDQERSPA